MSIFTSDPLALLAPQGGVISTPLNAEGASGAGNLDVPQRGAIIGEPVPIVFCRRISGSGGVLVSPPATEARFENSLTNEVTGFYHLVLSEGQIDSIQVRDVFQRSCRVGSFTQTYNRRAGTFVAGNFIVARGGSYTTPECPSYCGTSGPYTGMSTMAFQCTYPDGIDQWNRQVHCFVRGGMYVTRLLDNTLGPSNNVADLLLYLLRNSSRVPEAQIDTASLLAAATFTNVNGFWFNGVLTEATNLRDWMGDTLQYFLLRQTRIGGKEGLEPLIPTNANGTIKLTPVSWVFTFTEDHIIPGSFEISYTPLADRKPFCAMVLWRQQDDLGIGVVRTAEVRYTGTAIDGPFEQHDLSSFCSTETHAVKVGAYILSKRKNITHRLQIAVRPEIFNGTLAAGDIIRVRLERTASTGASSLHNYLYEVDRIGKSLAGDITLNLTHFPVDANLVSVVAQDVNAATGTGLIIPTGLSGVTCDVNSSANTSIPAETFTSGSFPNYGSSFGGASESGLGDSGAGNGSDGKDGQADFIEPSIGLEPEGALPGLPMTAEGSICPGATYKWFANGVQINGVTTPSFTPDGSYVGKNVTYEVTCPDGSVTTSPPISVAGITEFKFDGVPPFSCQVFFTLGFRFKYRYYYPNCNATPSAYTNGGSPTPGSYSFGNVTRIQPVRRVTQLPGPTIIGNAGPAYAYSKTCGATVYIDENYAILGLNGNTLVQTATPGGGSGTIGTGNDQDGISYLTVDSIILTQNVPGLGVTGDDVWRAGLGWFAQLSYIERFYGENYVNGVLQPFNPFGPPSTP